MIICQACLGARFEPNEISGYAGKVCTCNSINSKTLGVTEVAFTPAAPDKGVKHDGEKLDWSLLPFDATEDVVKVLAFGAKKYAPDNWKFVPDHERRYFSAAMRHLVAWQKGEKVDSETGISHLSHATCCLLFLISKELEKTDEQRT